MKITRFVFWATGTPSKSMQTPPAFPACAWARRVSMAFCLLDALLRSVEIPVELKSVAVMVSFTPLAAAAFLSAVTYVPLGQLWVLVMFPELSISSEKKATWVRRSHRMWLRSV